MKIDKYEIRKPLSGDIWQYMHLAQTDTYEFSKRLVIATAYIDNKKITEEEWSAIPLDLMLKLSAAAVEVSQILAGEEKK